MATEHLTPIYLRDLTIDLQADYQEEIQTSPRLKAIYDDGGDITVGHFLTHIEPAD